MLPPHLPESIDFQFTFNLRAGQSRIPVPEFRWHLQSVFRQFAGCHTFGLERNKVWGEGIPEGGEVNRRCRRNKVGRLFWLIGA